MVIGPGQTSHGLACNPGLFVGSHDVGCHFSTIQTDAGRVARWQPDRLFISLRVQHEPAPGHPVADTGTDFRGMFADASVLRRQLVEPFDLGHDGRVDADGLREPRSSVRDSMTHRVYNRVTHAFKHPLHGLTMIEDLSNVRSLAHPIGL